MSDRVAGLIILSAAIWLWIAAGGVVAGYGDPVGPALFPRLVAIPLGLFALVMIVRPDPQPAWPRADALVRQAVMLGVLFGYPVLIEPLGFPLATTIGAFCLCTILGARWRPASVTSVAIGVGLFVLFDQLLGLPLPLAPALLT